MNNEKIEDNEKLEKIESSALEDTQDIMPLEEHNDIEELCNVSQESIMEMSTCLCSGGCGSNYSSGDCLCSGNCGSNYHKG